MVKQMDAFFFVCLCTVAHVTPLNSIPDASNGMQLVLDGKKFSSRCNAMKYRGLDWPVKLKLEIGM